MGAAEELGERAHHKKATKDELITFFVESSFSSLPSRYRLFTSIILWRRIYPADWLSFLCFFSQNTRRRSMGTSSKGELEVCFFRLSFQLPPLRHILSFTLMSPTDRLWIRRRELFYLPALLLFSRSSSSPLSLLQYPFAPASSLPFSSSRTSTHSNGSSVDTTGASDSIALMVRFRSASFQGFRGRLETCFRGVLTLHSLTLFFFLRPTSKSGMRSTRSRNTSLGMVERGICGTEGE